MKANELMIGDWVHIDSMSKVPPHNDQVRKIFEKYCDTDNSFIGWEYVEPIPLTEEILKANGFRISHTDMLTTLYTIDGTPLQFEIGENNRFYGYWFSNNKITTPHYGVFSMRYVHELQHALRLCGLNDLADNFKIE